MDAFTTWHLVVILGVILAPALLIGGIIWFVIRRPTQVRQPPVETFPVDPRVPPFETWPSYGIVGQIGSGVHHGEWVLIGPYNTPKGNFDLILPRERTFDEDGQHLIDTPVTDSIRAPGAGGLIDLVTTALDVTWYSDEPTVRHAWATSKNPWVEGGPYPVG